MNTALLSVESLDAHYGPSHVLQGVSLQVSAGEVVALLGRNGAGKSTTLKTIMGIVKPSAGRICFEGEDLARLHTHAVARLGIAYVPEHRGIFPSLSVEEHFKVLPRVDKNSLDWSLEQVFELFPRLQERRTLSGGQLSGGEQQMLSIGRALLQQPRLLILDEPSEGLAPVVIQEISTALQALKQRGLTTLLVEQNFKLATRLSDRVSVLGKGRIRWQGSSSELVENSEVKHTWLGI